MNRIWNENSRFVRIVRDNSIYVILIIMLIVASVFSADFRTFSNISNLLSQSSIIGILAIGQTIVLITGGFDLSQSALIAMAAVVIALFMPYGYLAALICLVVLELANAFFVNKGISPFVVTLGMQGVARTLALWWSGQKSVAIQWSGIKSLAYSTFLGIPISVYLWLAMTVMLTLFLNRTVMGCHIYAIGGNAESARLSGINVKKVRYVAYLISAVCVFASSCIYVSRLGVGAPDKAIGYEMDAISVSIIGGTSLLGGSGTLKGTFAGMLIYGIITNFLNLMAVSAYWQKVIKGLIILIAVYFSIRANRKREVES